MSAISSRPVARSRRAGFLCDVVSVGERAIRSVIRDYETTITAVAVPVLFYLLTVGALEDFAEQLPEMDYRAF